MSNHQNVYGICENLCKVPVYAKNQTDELIRLNRGSKLIVTTEDSALYGQTVTATLGTYSMTGVMNNEGYCELRVDEIGTYTVTCGSANDAEVEVPYFGIYEVEMITNHATIHVVTNDAIFIGQTVTATKGSYSVSGVIKNNGTCDLMIKQLGTYTVTCGGKSASVSVAEFFETYNVPISVMQYLYNAGDECVDVTGGWSASGYTTSVGNNKSPSKDNNTLYVEGSYWGGDPADCFIGVANAINLTSYSTLKVRWKATSRDISVLIVSSKSNFTDSSKRIKTISVSKTESSDYIEKTLDISDVSGSYYVVVYASTPSSDSSMYYNKGYVQKIWLE